MDGDKISRCNAEGICTAQNNDDMKTCKHYEPEKTMLPALCIFYAHRADDCLCAAANEEARGITARGGADGADIQEDLK